MKTYTEQLSNDEWNELIEWLLPFGSAVLDNFKYDLPYQFPCRVIYKNANALHHTVEVTINNQGNPHSFDNNPAVIFEWTFIRKYHLDNGQLHNTSGPAFIGRHVKRYALDGNIYQSFDDWVNDLHNYMPNEDVLAIKLKGKQ